MKLLAIFAIPAMMFAGNSASASEPKMLPFAGETRWHGWTPDGQVVEINNVNGNVRVESTNGEEIEVVALKHGSGNPENVAIEIVEHKGGVTVCAVYPNANSDHPFECRPSHGGGFRMAAESSSTAHIRWENGGGGDMLMNDMRVDFIVRLPRGLRFIGRTVDGEVDAHLVEQDVEAHSVRGDVTVDVDPWGGGEFRAESALGEVSSDLEPLTVKTDRDHGNFISAHFGHFHRMVRVKSAAGNVRLQRVRVL
jgi:hypothetical protein